MTTINCSSSCIYQKDGKCTLDNTTVDKLTPREGCIYFKNNIDKI